MSQAPTGGVPFVDDGGAPAVRGILHRPDGTPTGDALVLTHGAGATCETPLLIALAGAFAARGLTVLRCDLPFRQDSATGPPSPATASRDREGLRRAVHAVRRLAPHRVFLGGHSYGGRQASILAADDPKLVDALLLLAYPLRPPRRPAEPRTVHFPRLRTPALFVHGSRDPFGSPGELRSAIRLIPGSTGLLLIEGGGHDLSPGRRRAALAADPVARVVGAFMGLTGS